MDFNCLLGSQEKAEAGDDARDGLRHFPSVRTTDANYQT